MSIGVAVELSGYDNKSLLDCNWQFDTFPDLNYLLQIINMYILCRMLPLVFGSRLLQFSVLFDESHPSITYRNHLLLFPLDP